MPHWLGITLGLIILVLTWVSVVSTLVLPRPMTGPVRLSLWVTRSTRRCFFALARFRRTYEGKDATLAPIGPVALLVQLAAWLVLLGIGFSIMLVPYTDDVGHAASEVGAAMFTLGLARSARFTNDTIVIAAAASGFVVIALQIAYLPALYATFNRRESLITMLASRAGEPSWGPEILIRHQLVGIVDSLPDFYGQWEQWSADFSESHSTYPVLLLFRSPDPWSSWAVALLAVLDAAAMHLALNPTTAPSQARLSLRMGYTALRRISAALGWSYDPDPLPDDPISLTPRRVRACRTTAARGRVRDRARARRGVGALPRVAGELRRPRVPLGRTGDGATRAVVGTAPRARPADDHPATTAAPFTRHARPGCLSPARLRRVARVTPGRPATEPETPRRTTPIRSAA